MMIIGGNQCSPRGFLLQEPHAVKEKRPYTATYEEEEIISHTHKEEEEIKMQYYMQA
jgi:hypothetical protein